MHTVCVFHFIVIQPHGSVLGSVSCAYLIFICNNELHFNSNVYFIIYVSLYILFILLPFVVFLFLFFSNSFPWRMLFFIINLSLKGKNKKLIGFSFFSFFFILFRAYRYGNGLPAWYSIWNVRVQPQQFLHHQFTNP